MSCRRLTRLLILLVIAVLLLPSTRVHSAAAQDSPTQPKVLLLYDSLAKGTAREGNVRELQRQLSAYNVQVTLISLDRYEAGTMASFSKVITVVNTPDLVLTGKAYSEDVESYKGQYLHIGFNPPAKLQQSLKLTLGIAEEQNADLSIGEFTGTHLQVEGMPYISSSEEDRAYGRFSLSSSGRKMPYAISGGNFTYAPYLEQGNASVLGMAYVLKEWLAAGATPQTYLVLREIYPFSNLALLEETAERLYQAGIPFIASVRPVFNNTDFPAMQRYLDALRVVQSRNGSILVNAPVVMPSINSSDHTLKEKMSGFVDLLVENGIAPLGIGADAYWTYDKEYSEAGMGFFDSAVLFPDDTVIDMEPSNVSKVFSSSLYSMTPEFLQGLGRQSKVMPQLPLNTAITVNLPEDEAGLEELLHSLDEEWIAFADYKQGAHKVVTDANTVVSADGVVTVGDKPLNIEYTPKAVNVDYQYKEEQVKSFTKLFGVQNKFFIVVIIIALLLFGGLLTVGNRLYRKKFLK